MTSHRFRRWRQRMGYRFPLRSRCLALAMLAIIGLAGYGLHLYTSVFCPALCRLGIAQSARIGQEIINTSVAELFGKDPSLPARLITVERSEEGQIAAVRPDVLAMNVLKSELTLAIQDKLQKTQRTLVAVPVGNLTGAAFLSNRGPRLKMDMLPYGKVWVDMESRFSSAGINQTRHQLTAVIALDVSLLAPGYPAIGNTVTARIPLSETVVVGSVPDSYTNLESTPGQIREDLVNILD